MGARGRVRSRRTLEEARAAAPRSGGPVFQTFRGGYAQLYEALAEQSRAKIYLDTFISGITREGEGYRLTGGEDAVYDTVILAVPAPTSTSAAIAIAAQTASSFLNISIPQSCVRAT